MTFVSLPPSAAWVHQEARTGFEVVHFTVADGGHHVVGCTAAQEDGVPWAVWYEIDLSSAWASRRARISNRTVGGERQVELEQGDDRRWLVDGVPRPDLDGCLDVDLESSALTNAFPVHRLELAVGARAEAPAVYVRAADLSVERLEQGYERLPDENGGQAFRYTSPAFAFECTLEYDESGLVLTYPGIAVRSAVRAPRG